MTTENYQKFLEHPELHLAGHAKWIRRTERYLKTLGVCSASLGALGLSEDDFRIIMPLDALMAPFDL